MIELAQQNNINLVFVRMKRRRDAQNEPTPQALTQYINHLQTYLQNQNVPLIDFTNNPQITLDQFAAGDHLNNHTGTPLFTQLLAENLKPIL
ncbi:MAG: hypothetical protein GY869_10355 [Planctomycetes bacterium]|nr:hypothetical protein [Planctomycetota bacterium]